LLSLLLPLLLLLLWSSSSSSNTGAYSASESMRSGGLLVNCRLEASCTAVVLRLRFGDAGNLGTGGKARKVGVDLLRLSCFDAPPTSG
jgi:hypothetical protein